MLVRQGWANKEGDEHFKQQRQRADHADDKGRLIFFNMMRYIGDELQDATGVLSMQEESPEVLDLCMAPGGYTASVLKYSPKAQVSGITLPEKEGGHKLLIRRGFADPRIQVTQLDITMLWSEFCAEDIPEDHPDKAEFLHGERPYLNKSFDLIFCDGQVLRTHTRSTYRDRKEALRLSCSQLILAMQRIRPGGTMIILLHKVDAWDTVNLLFQFSSFASLQLFKPKKKHGTRSSFYLIATKINPHHPEAISAVAGWKSDWREATFAYKEDVVDVRKSRLRNNDEESQVLTDFGSTLVRLGDPVWAIQRDNLRNAAFIRNQSTENSQLPVSPTPPDS
jgi:23S rRNA U2552 (ribose-2'-O)-methylase RlmE/FtsJ